MATTVATFTAKSMELLLQQVNSLLSTLLAHQFVAFDFDAKDVASYNAEYRIVLEYEPSASVLVSPMIIVGFDQPSLQGSGQALQDWLDAYPTYFASVPYAAYITGDNGRTRRNPILIATNMDADEGALAWLVGGGGGAGDLYTQALPMPAPLGGYAAGTTFLNQTMQQMWDGLLYPYLAPPVALVLATPVVVDSVLVDSAGDVRWNLNIYNPTTGVRYSWSIDATNDGTASSDATDAAWTITGLGPNSADVIDVTLLGAGAAQAMRLVVTAAAAGFFAQVSRSVLSAGAS